MKYCNRPTWKEESLYYLPFIITASDSLCPCKALPCKSLKVYYKPLSYLRLNTCSYIGECCTTSRCQVAKSDTTLSCIPPPQARTVSVSEPSGMGKLGPKLILLMCIYRIRWVTYNYHVCVSSFYYSTVL